jgi:hypothetical protein
LFERDFQAAAPFEGIGTLGIGHRRRFRAIFRPFAFAINVDQERGITVARQRERTVGPVRRHAKPIGRNQQKRPLAGLAFVIDQLAGKAFAADGIANGLDGHRGFLTERLKPSALR